MPTCPANDILENSSEQWKTCKQTCDIGSGDARKQTNYQLRLLHGNSNPLLAADIAQHLNITITPANVGHYANGEVNIQVLHPVRGDDCFVIQPTCARLITTETSEDTLNVNQSLMELLLLIQTLRLSSAKRITAVIPHFGYARQDRKTHARVPISASAVATMIATMGINRVITMDLHCAQIQGFFQNIPVFDISSASIFAHYITYESGIDMNQVVIVAPDAGAVARARKLADILGVSRIVTILKRRLCANKVESMQLVGEVKGAVCLIFDDMIDTAGTLCKAASVLVEWGATSVFAFATHGILTDPAISRIMECSALTQVVVTDTIPQETNQRACAKLRVLSSARLIGEVIRRIHFEESFDDVEQMVFDVARKNGVRASVDEDIGSRCYRANEIRK